MNPEDLLTEVLRERTEDTDYASTPLATVSKRAGAIRARRRRTAILAAAAAVAVVVVPGAVWLNRSPSSSPGPSQQVTTAPTRSPSAPSSTPPTVALNSLPQGPKPRVDYIDASTFIGILGERVTLPPGTESVVRSRGGGLIVATARRSPERVFTDGTAGNLEGLVPGNGSTTNDLGCGATRFAWSVDGTLSAYWQMTGCDPTSGGKLFLGALSTMSQAGPQGWPTPAGEVYQPVGILGGAAVVVNVVTPQGVSAGVWVVDPTGRHRIPGLEAALSVSGSTGVVAGEQADGNSVVVDPSTGEVRWSAPPGWVLGSFSSDGAHIVARKAGGGVSQYAVFDAHHGGRQLDVPAIGGTEVLQTAWGSDGALMLVVDDHQSSAIVRCTLAGRLSIAAPAKPDGAVAHYRFVTTS